MFSQLFLLRSLHDRSFDHKGIVRYSPIYELPAPFNVMWNVPCEEFHLLREGVGKLLLKRLFEDSNTAVSRAIFAQLDAAYQACAVFSETPRCSRKITTAKLKGSELGFLINSAFPYLVKLLSGHAEPHW